MKSIAIITAFLTVALAAPSPDAISRSIERRRHAREHKAVQLAAVPHEYDINWAGAAVHGSGITEAEGTFKVLTAKVPTKKEAGESEYTASAWVGLDGAGGCPNGGLWQAGIDSIVEANGRTSFYAWYEWYPAGTEVIQIGDIHAGDEIYVKVQAITENKGSVILENKTTGKTFSKTMTSNDRLCGSDAEWIMEDVTFNDDKTGLPNFGAATFTGVSYVQNGKTSKALNTAEIMDIQDDHNIKLTDTKVTGNTVVISYLP